MKRFLFWLIVFVAVVWAGLLLASRKTFPVEYGVSFSQLYAKEIGLDPKEVYGQIMTDLKPKYVRLAAHWTEVEKQEGIFDFTDLDYYMDESKKNGAKVVLTVGQKVPRWPECFIPFWFDPNEQGAEEVFQRYVKTVVERYKTHEALELWQVENEPFIRFPFGECTKFKESWVEKEVVLVRSLDTIHPIVITDSGEMGTWRKARKTGDIFGTTLYRVVRMQRGTRLTYDIIPPAVYRLKAYLLGVTYPDKFFVSELQAEPWFDGGGVLGTPLSRQYETMTKDRFMKHLDVAERTGASRAYLWGVEWWYWLKTTHGESSMWDTGKEILSETR
jgi:hypothetical protein